MTTFSRTLGSAKKRLSIFLRRFFKKKRTRIGIYGPPNAGKTTLGKPYRPGLDRRRGRAGERDPARDPEGHGSVRIS